MAYRKSNKQPSVVYSDAVLNRTVSVKMNMVGKNIAIVIHNILVERYEGFCSVEGYIKPGSIQIIEHSSGLLSSSNVTFEVVFKCQICFPVEGMDIMCIVKNITKAGIRCDSTENPSPMVIFIARDHHYSNDQFASIKEDAIIKVKVIGQRFELNDTYISIIGELTTGHP